jgi:hypothetical protein
VNITFPKINVNLIDHKKLYLVKQTHIYIHTQQVLGLIFGIDLIFFELVGAEKSLFGR